MLAREAVSMLPHLAGGLLSVRPGVFASDDADGRVTLLLSGEARPLRPRGASLSMTVTGCLDTLRWLETMEVTRPPQSVTVSARWPVWPGRECSENPRSLRSPSCAPSSWSGRLSAPSGMSRRATSRRPVSWPTLPLTVTRPSARTRQRSAAIAQRFRFGPPRRG